MWLTWRKLKKIKITAEINEIEKNANHPNKLLKAQIYLYENIIIRAKPRLLRNRSTIKIFLKKHKRTMQNKYNFDNKFENSAIKISFLERI